MNIYIAFSLFSLIILLYWVITELFTIFFRFTGLPEEKARFQVISLLTGCGFTTRESEMILSNRRRRRLARIIMLFGYVFNITFISALINVFLTLKASDRTLHHIVGQIIPLIAAAIIFLFIRIPRIHTWGENLLELLAGRIRGEQGNLVMPLDYLGKDSIALITLRQIPEQYGQGTFFRHGDHRSSGTGYSASGSNRKYSMAPRVFSPLKRGSVWTRTGIRRPALFFRNTGCSRDLPSKMVAIMGQKSWHRWVPS